MLKILGYVLSVSFGMTLPMPTLNLGIQQEDFGNLTPKLLLYVKMGFKETIERFLSQIPTQSSCTKINCSSVINK
jgi:hypothetical protein